MEIFGIGPLELIFIFLIALIVLGPTDMVKAGRTIGRFLRKLVMSPTWRSFQQASKDIRYLPNKLMRDAGLEEDLKAVEEIARQARFIGAETGLSETGESGQDISSWITTPSPSYRPERSTIAPPREEASTEPAESGTVEDPG